MKPHPWRHSTPPTSTSTTLHLFDDFSNALASFLPSTTEKSVAVTTKRKKVNDLKSQLLDVCRSNTNNVSREEQRTQIENIIQQLQPLSSTSSSAASPLLQKVWKLEWTTEKEINLFLDKGWSTQIGQTIDGNVLENNIDFENNIGGLYVTGKLNVPDPTGIRTNFEFNNARLKLWSLDLNLPPVGKGWFDTIYLDESLRVDINSRNDILICTPLQTKD